MNHDHLTPCECECVTPKFACPHLPRRTPTPPPVAPSPLQQGGSPHRPPCALNRDRVARALAVAALRPCSPSTPPWTPPSSPGITPATSPSSTVRLFRGVSLAVFFLCSPLGVFPAQQQHIHGEPPLCPPGVRLNASTNGYTPLVEMSCHGFGVHVLHIKGTKQDGQALAPISNINTCVGTLQKTFHPSLGIILEVPVPHEAGRHELASKENTVFDSLKAENAALNKCLGSGGQLKIVGLVTRVSKNSPDKVKLWDL